MIIYLEKQAKNYKLTEKIISNFKNSEIIEISNYKNIFDKNIPFYHEKAIIIAKLRGNAIGEVPPNYSPYKKAYFFKTSLNCIFDCKYCYLKGAFKNNFQVYFVNYDEIKLQISNLVNSQKSDDTICFYSSDYSDNLGTNNLNDFVGEFVPFFEKLQNVIMEIRTKSCNIKPLIDLNFIPKNTEIAFSLNPQEIIQSYENLTSKLDDRIDAINKLLNLNFKVGLRFLPLLPVKNFENIYSEFIAKLKQKIDFSKINSINISGLMYTKEDFTKMLKKFPRLDILYFLEESDDNFVRLSQKHRDFFYKLFSDLGEKCFICLDKK